MWDGSYHPQQVGDGDFLSLLGLHTPLLKLYPNPFHTKHIFLRGCYVCKAPVITTDLLFDKVTTIDKCQRIPFRFQNCTGFNIHINTSKSIPSKFVHGGWTDKFVEENIENISSIIIAALFAISL